MKTLSLGKFGRIVQGTLEEVGENAFRLTVISKGEKGHIFIDTSDIPFDINYGVFADDYEKGLTSADKIQLEGEIRRYVKSNRSSVHQ
ncbi:hypothetical protein QCI44_06700 [Bacillus cereus group sp. RP37]|uniref:hypothetical protein n=1 Tax=unclassified Bacillus cereus group TaxID=2750818 RepID=UPI000BEC3D25|nr:hypothetical protein [Bacillus cereus group sp. TH228LC]PEF46134.1 hypothetical protein CON22_13280 [Bacillus cereus]PFW83449.1 hypothetical protein COL27_14895 [Bacillus sp. AFS075960]HDR7655424.1 hypothetical protein [Bacillus wiedmannii]MDA1577579.1 hypothetical protein [Bacillus cereus group sp. TH228LC]PGU96520.1 hypothetical protein COD71_05720 [Bacillus cereus]